MSELAVRELHKLRELAAASALFEEIWGSAPGASPMGTEQMRALSHAGNYVAGAFADGRLVGASVAFFAAPVGQALHSHVTGALSGHAAGPALKWHQRAWALSRGLSTITWTFDPLVRRNAHFNLAKLGARPVEYLTGFYGSLDDAINGGDDTDRALVAWDLSHPAEAPSAPPPVRVPADAVTALSVRDGLPVLGTVDSPTLLVDVPPDIEALRRSDPGAAKAWRLALRQVLGGLLAEGARVTGFHNRTSYVVTRRPAQPKPM
ncbi:GNAT family N-acetyltransferase [Streptomyces alboniger]|uniref:GNAT family N-acetyltransferase n=1 Tax=Streptomyces alboniger TaxID=132473 RepID=A0A5J6HTK7_STRAD|nr:GNAT family N-acetyltransferase [Streptomyces alboniger]QEV21621.1 GNAT family N-acetyltransferase [Streptomyces alboniger]